MSPLLGSNSEVKIKETLLCTKTKEDFVPKLLIRTAISSLGKKTKRTTGNKQLKLLSTLTVLGLGALWPQEGWHVEA